MAQALRTVSVEVSPRLPVTVDRRQKCPLTGPQELA
jgi:hypothetical protein